MKGQLRITEIYAFVVIDDDGTEGVPAIRTPGGMVLPLVSADTARVESLRPYAEQLARDMSRPVELIRFSVREQIEVIEP